MLTEACIVTGEVDSGSYCTIPPKDKFDQKFPKARLKALQEHSYAYRGVPIKQFIGSFWTEAKLNGTPVKHV